LVGACGPDPSGFGNFDELPGFDVRLSILWRTNSERDPEENGEIARSVPRVQNHRANVLNSSGALVAKKLRRRVTRSFGLCRSNDDEHEDEDEIAYGEVPPLAQ
jgi:hypothetical protein